MFVYAQLGRMVWGAMVSRRPQARFDRVAADRFLGAVRAGAPEGAAARVAGVDPDMIQRWVVGKSAANRRFAADVLEARAGLAVSAAAVVTEAIGSDWRAAVLVSDQLRVEDHLARLRELTTD